MITRRNLLVGVLAAATAPAIVRAKTLMPLAPTKHVFRGLNQSVTYGLTGMNLERDMAEFVKIDGSGILLRQPQFLVIRPSLEAEARRLLARDGL